MLPRLLYYTIYITDKSDGKDQRRPEGQAQAQAEAHARATQPTPGRAARAEKPQTPNPKAKAKEAKTERSAPSSQRADGQASRHTTNESTTQEQIGPIPRVEPTPRPQRARRKHAIPERTNPGKRATGVARKREENHMFHVPPRPVPFPSLTSAPVPLPIPSLPGPARPIPISVPSLLNLPPISPIHHSPYSTLLYLTLPHPTQ
ncbi:hypothetical protein EAF00_002193 [Botryotinia globosa]|nr:hypothetical protein EAF00_002193 [Botryotinia globosa]